MRYVKKQITVPTQGKEAVNRNCSRVSPNIGLNQKIKFPVLSMFKNMEIISKELLENMRMISQIKRTNKDTVIIKENQIEIITLESTITKMKRFTEYSTD